MISGKDVVMIVTMMMMIINTVNPRLALFILDFCMGAYSKEGGLTFFLVAGHFPAEILLLKNYFFDAATYKHWDVF